MLFTSFYRPLQAIYGEPTSVLRDSAVVALAPVVVEAPWPALSWQHAATNRLRLPIPDLARPGVLGARAARHRLGGSGLCGFNRELSPKPRGCTADIEMRNRTDRTPRKWLQSLSGRHYFVFRVRFRLVACVCLTVSIGALYQWTPCPSVRPMFRSSAK